MSIWVEWSPGFAPHVMGRYTRRTFDPETRMPEPQKIEVTCGICHATWRGECLTGQVRTHIARFGTVHLHRDPLDNSKDPALGRRAGRIRK